MCPRYFFAALPLLLFVAGCDSADPTPVRPSPTPSRVALSVFPTSVLRSGSSVTLTARVTDDAGSNVTDTAVAFATSTGELSAASASTGSAGMATVTLTASEPARVTATAGGARAEVDLEAVAPFSVRVSPRGTVGVGATVDVPVEVQLNRSVADPPRPAAVTIDCGTGGGTQDVTVTLVGRCTFANTGSYTVRASARAANGWTVTDSTDVSIANPTTPAVTFLVTVSSTHVGGREWRIGVNATAPMRQVHIQFGEHESSTTIDPDGSRTFVASSHVYPAMGTYTATVRAEPVNGTPVTQTITIDVE
jgi:hypothetical protein